MEWLMYRDHIPSTDVDYFPVYNFNRNVMGMMNQLGALVAWYEYDPFGKPIKQGGVNGFDATNPFGFFIQHTDSETGLVYWQRYYDHSLTQSNQAFWSIGGQRDADLLNGIGSGFTGAFTGLWNTVRHPGETLSSISDAGKAIWNDPLGTASGAASGLWNQIQTPEGRGEIYGGTAAGAMTFGAAWFARGLKITKGLGSNPFLGKTQTQIDSLLRSRGFDTRGPDPASGRGSYFHPESGRKYYLDPGGTWKAGTELPHVDVHRLENGRNLEDIKRKYPLGN